MRSKYFTVTVLLLFSISFVNEMQAQIKIDTQTKLGVVKPVNGYQNGPVFCSGSAIEVDNSSEFKQANFPYIRLHDVNYPMQPQEVDIDVIFKDFDADADDPANYDFRATDEYINSIEAVGAKVIYRLGTTKIFDHYPSHPPKDFSKWAKICLNVARHYNEGWANGYHKNILYWEVWNEPEMKTRWTGTPQQFYELYATVARLFKKEMPHVKIGGYGASDVRGNFFKGFLLYVQENDLPLDFFSWHRYDTSVDMFRRLAISVRELLDLHGFTETESILDEWAYFSNNWGLFKDPTGGRKRWELFLESQSMIAASFIAAMLIEMLNMPIDIATYYQCTPGLWWSPFNTFGVPEKIFYPFVAFNQTINGGERALAECTVPGIYTLAVTTGAELRIMLANYKGKTGAYNLDVMGLDKKARYKSTLHILDEQRDFEIIEERAGLSHADILRSVYLQENTVAMITISVM